MGSTLIYYQRVPTDSARRLGCAGILDLCSRLPASGLSRPEARWPDKVLFSAEKSGALRASAAGRRGLGMAKVIFAGAKIGAASRLWPAGRGVVLLYFWVLEHVLQLLSPYRWEKGELCCFLAQSHKYSQKVYSEPGLYGVGGLWVCAVTMKTGY